MKKTSLILSTLLLFAGGVWADEDRVGHYKKVLMDCGNPSISVLKIKYGALFSSTNLDLDCVKEKFNKHQAERKLYLSEETRIKTVVGSDYLKQKNNMVKNSPPLQNIKTITSMYSETCGQQCLPAEDFIYQTGNRYWFLFTNSSSQMNVLKINEIGDPQLIFYTNSESNTYIENYLINIPLNKVVKLGQGWFEFKNVGLNEVDYKRKQIKSYFKGGGAFWFDSIETYSFKSDSKNVQFINAEGKGVSCFPRETFLEMTGFMEKLFKDFEEVCVYT